MEQTDEIAKRRGLLSAKDRLPRTLVHDGIVKVLNDFATDITRYYNLEFVTSNSNIEKKDDKERPGPSTGREQVTASRFGPTNKCGRE